MNTTSQTEREAVLDACIDLLLQDREWESRLPSDEPETAEELGALMQIAAWLLDMAHRAPTLDAGRFRRVWSRWNARAYQERTGRLTLLARPLNM